MDLPCYVNRPSLVWILHPKLVCSNLGCWQPCHAPRIAFHSQERAESGHRLAACSGVHSDSVMTQGIWKDRNTPCGQHPWKAALKDQTSVEREGKTRDSAFPTLSLLTVY